MEKVIPKRIFVLFLASLLMLIIISTLMYYNIRQFLNSNRWETHTYQVMNNLEIVISDLKDIETGTRGYLITGNEGFLEPYQNALKDLPSSLSTLRSLTSDNNSQLQRLRQLERLINEKLKLQENQISLRKSKGFEQSAASFNDMTGNRKMDEIRKSIAGMQYVENKLLNQRIKDREAKTLDIFVITGIIILLLACAIISVLIFLRKDLETKNKMHKLMKDSLDYANMIIDTVTTPLLVLDANLNIINENRSFYSSFNYTKEQIENKSFFEIIKGKFDYQDLRAQLHSVIPENTSVDNYELEIADNRIISMNARKLFRTFNNVHLILVGIEDITVRKEIEHERFEFLKRVQTAQAEAEAARDHFISLFQSAPGLYLVLTPEDYKIDAVSDAYLKATMTKREDILGKKLFEVFPDDPNIPEADGVRNLSASLQRVKKNKRADIMGIQRYPIPKPDSEGDGFEDRYWSPINSPVFDQNGNMAYIIHRVEDVTEYIRIKENEGNGIEAYQTLKSMEQHMEAEIVLRARELMRLNDDLRELQKELLEVQKIGNVGSWDYDIATGRLVLSEQGLRIFAIKPEKTIPESSIWFRIVYPEDELPVAKVIKRALASGNGKNLEHNIRGSNGETCIINTWSEVLTDPGGKPKRSLGMIQDITERKKTEEDLKTAGQKLKQYSEELEDLNETKDKLFSIVAHDLRSPFQVLSSVANLLIENLETFNKEEIILIANELKKTVQIQYEVVDNLLTWVQLQRGKMQFNPRRIFLYDKINLIIDQLKIHAQKKDIVMVNSVPKNYVAVGDTEMLQTVLHNLILNGIKYCNIGGHIELKAERSGQEIITSVSDNGVGMDKGLIDLMFTFNKNINREGTIGEKGTGLGLHLCKEMIEKQNGKIWVESELGKGSTFYFTLPAED